MTIKVSRKEIHRMTASVLEGNEMTKDASKLKREQLKRLSDLHVSKWTDTLDSKRKARLQWKQKYQDQMEEKRVQLDKEESNYQSKMKNALLQKAQNLICEEHEKIRSLRSQQLYVDAIEGREKQITENNCRKKKGLQEEKQWHEEKMDKLNNEEALEKEKQHYNNQKQKEYAETLKQQRKKEKMHRTKKLEEAKQQEIQKIQQKLTEDFSREQDSFFKKIEQRKKAKHDFIKLQHDTQKEKKLQIQLEQEEENKRKKQIEQMNELTMARKAISKKIFDKRQKKRELLSDVASAELRKRSNDELELFISNQKKKEENNEKKKNSDEIKKKKIEKEIHKCRQDQIVYKKNVELKVQEENEIYATLFEKGRLNQKDKDQKDTLQRKIKKDELSKFQQLQREKNKLKKEQGLLNDLHFIQQSNEKIKHEDAFLKEFARKEIEKFRSQGKKIDLFARQILE